MMPHDPSSEVQDAEWLARFIFSSSHIRSSDSTVRPDAFIPPPKLDLSVTRHLNLSDEDIWRAGKLAGLAPVRQTATLYGRADLQAVMVRQNNLQVNPAPLPNNPAHAIIVGWPIGKPEQKIIAMELARTSRYVRNPELNS